MISAFGIEHGPIAKALNPFGRAAMAASTRRGPGAAGNYAMLRLRARNVGTAGPPLPAAIREARNQKQVARNIATVHARKPRELP